MNIDETKTRPGTRMGLTSLIRRIMTLPQIPGQLAVRPPNDERAHGFSLLRTGETPAVEIAVIHDNQGLGHVEARDYAALLSGSPDMLRVLRGAVELWGGAVERDEEIVGSDAVDWLGGFVTQARAVLQSMVETAAALPEQGTMQAAGRGDPPETHDTRRGTVRVFFTRVPLRTVDIIPAHDVTNDPRGQYSGKTLAELSHSHPGVEIGDICAMAPLRHAVLGRAPVQTLECVFREAMEGVPPFDYCHRANGETFKVGETACGALVEIHVRIGKRFWVLTDRATLPHDEIIRMVVDADDRHEMPVNHH